MIFGRGWEGRGATIYCGSGGEGRGAIDRGRGWEGCGVGGGGCDCGAFGSDRGDRVFDCGGGSEEFESAKSRYASGVVAANTGLVLGSDSVGSAIVGSPGATPRARSVILPTSRRTGMPSASTGADIDCTGDKECWPSCVARLRLEGHDKDSSVAS
jgi:hypothetical protein